MENKLLTNQDPQAVRADSIKANVKALYDVKSGQSGGRIFSVNANIDDDTISNMHNNYPLTLQYFRQRKIETALSLGCFSRGNQILEVGCNLGQFTTQFNKLGYFMTGIDIANTVAVAQRNAELNRIKNIRYLEADVENMKVFADETFDGVVSFSTLRYVPNLPLALKEIFRVLKRRGTIALDFPNKYCPWFSLLKKSFGQGEHIHDNFFSASQLTDLLLEAGFCNIKIRKVMFIHYTFPPQFVPLYRFIDLLCENIWGLKEMAAIIMCGASKP